MDYLKSANLVCEGTLELPRITASGKRGRDHRGRRHWGDCLGTVHRQGSVSVTQLEILPMPGLVRAPDNPWPTWPVILRSTAAHEEGGERLFSVGTAELVDDGSGAVCALRADTVGLGTLDGRPTMVPVPGTAFQLEADLSCSPWAFSGRRSTVAWPSSGSGWTPGATSLSTSPSRRLSGRVRLRRHGAGQSLIVWAIAEGRSLRPGVDRYLTGREDLFAPVVPGQLALR